MFGMVTTFIVSRSRDFALVRALAPRAYLPAQPTSSG